MGGGQGGGGNIVSVGPVVSYALLKLTCGSGGRE